DAARPALNASLTIIVLTPLTMVPVPSGGLSNKYWNSLEFFHRGVASRQGPEKLCASLSRGLAVPCAGRPERWSRRRPGEHDAGSVQSQSRWLHFHAAAPDPAHHGRRDGGPAVDPRQRAQSPQGSAARVAGATADAARAVADRPDPDL